VTTLELLKAADALLTPLRFSKGYFARTLIGTACDPSSPWAVRFCAVGAIKHFTEGNIGALDLEMKARSVLNEASDYIFDTDAYYVNDNYGFDAVKRVYAEAIRCEAERTTSGEV
jgi:hypothetical protein